MNVMVMPYTRSETMATVDALTSCLLEYHLFAMSVSFLYLQIIVFKKKLSQMGYDLPDDGYHLKSHWACQHCD